MPKLTDLKPAKKQTVYSPEEELFNAITHAFGIIGGLVGMVYLWLQKGLSSAVFGSSFVFLFSVIMLYSASTLYHSVKAKKQKLLLKKIDHISIYLLIAGTFTPFTWGVLGCGPIGRNLSIAIWGIALLGVVFKIFFTGKFEIISLLSYIGMGWLGFFMFGSISEVLGQEVVNIMLYGGAAYTVGVVFYVMRKVKYHHGIWHLFVLLGTGFHAFAIFKCIIR